MRFELDSCVLANLGYEFSESALSDTISKSACAFPRISMAASVWVSFLARIRQGSDRVF
ncbi:hypothetical protein HNR07_002224 [Nocardiopsis metallicus]|uniref:Uncharacterized protein n=1 Tax=Nocardiopsis metallicus TaxID=179819 RepID=A0A840WHA8_9ACTN|nr:hypothetical protein [Nocardiopsis metallicus]